MANPPQPATPASNLIDVLRTYSGAAWRAYTDTVEVASGKPGDQLTPTSTPLDEKQIQQAQAKNTAAFSQLVTAAKLVAEQDGRDGYLAVVQLMQKTAQTADKVCEKLLEVLHADGSGGTPQTTDVPVINAFIDALRALAELSPDSAWATPQPPANQ